MTHQRPITGKKERRYMKIRVGRFVPVMLLVGVKGQRSGGFMFFLDKRNCRFV